MKKRPSSEEIFDKIEREESMDRKRKRMEREKEKHEQRLKSIDSKFDLNDGTYINSSSMRNERTLEEMTSYHHNRIKDESRLIDMEFGLDEYDDERIYIPRRNNRDNKNRQFIKYCAVGICSAITAAIITGSIVSYNTKKKCQEDEINRKMATYLEEIPVVIEESTHPKKQYIYMDYENISNYIENSDNPDLAALVLYRLYGHSSKPEHNRMIRRTFETLSYDGSKYGAEDNYDNYIHGNGYEKYDEYYEACLQELVRDGDSKLDNLRLTLKKND